MVEINAIGGYNEVGKNMTAVKIKDEAVIFDMGLHLEPYIKYTENEDAVNIDPKELIKAGAVPNIDHFYDWKKNVRAILPTHAHLDHVGAIPYISSRYDAPIICTPFTKAVINTILRSEKMKVDNPIKVLNSNSVFKLSKNLKVEFINITHSTPQTVMIALHTPEGIILYANDFKFDLFPTLGQKPDFKVIKRLGQQGVKALIVDSTYSGVAAKTPSESVAYQMLQDVMLGTDSSHKGMIVTTFSSHLARLKSILEFGRKLNRKVVFMGRSLGKYIAAGEEVGIVNFSKSSEIVGYGKQLKRTVQKIMRTGKEKYLMVVTGHQGEPGSMLWKLMNGDLGYRFDSEDHVIFSCKVIPTPTNIHNREMLEQDLKKYNVRLFKDIHVSGHCEREDLRDLINMTKPEHLIPAHGEVKMTSALFDLGKEMGYVPGETVHLIQDGERIKL
jgi:ribonuclease J